MNPEVLGSFRGVKVVVAGDVMLDRYHWGAVSRISPEAPVPVVRLVSTSIAAGGAANVAANVVGLGASARLFGVVGRDGEGRELGRALRSGGIAPEDLIAADARPTTVKTRIIAHSQHVVRLDQESTEPLLDDVRTEFISGVSSALDEADILVLSDYGKGLLDAPTTTRLITSAKELGKPVLVDPKGKDYSKYRGATLITPNQREAREACSLEDIDPIESAGERFLRDFDIAAALVTQGEAGMTLFEPGGRMTRFAARARKVYDVTGAGDTVIATLATALGAGCELRVAVEISNVAAGIAVESVGTSAVSVSAIVEYLREHS